jgi:hypothetical protein
VASQVKALLRIVALSAVLTAAVLPTASAQAASFFKSDSGGTSIEVHVVDGKITFLTVAVPITCDGDHGPTFYPAIGGRKRIPLDPLTGAFSYVDGNRSKQGETNRAVFRGTIFNGELRATYEYAYGNVVTGATCWSGDSFRGSPDQPEGSPVQINVSRQKGLRFYDYSDYVDFCWSGAINPGCQRRIYVWVGGGKVYGLRVTWPETCISSESHSSPAGITSYTSAPQRASTELYRAANWPIRVNPRTHEIHYREDVEPSADASSLWRVDAKVSRDHLEGRLSHTYHYQHTYQTGPEGEETVTSTSDCHTGSRANPWVAFTAPHS